MNTENAALQASTAVSLVAWAIAELADGILGSHTAVVEQLARLVAAGVAVHGLSLECAPNGRLASTEVSGYLQRMQATGIVHRMAVPLQVTAQGQSILARHLQDVARGAEGPSLRAALHVLGIPEHRLLAPAGPLSPRVAPRPSR